MRTPIISPDNNTKYNKHPTGLVPELEPVNSQGNSQNNSAQQKPIHKPLNNNVDEPMNLNPTNNESKRSAINETDASIPLLLPNLDAFDEPPNKKQKIEPNNNFEVIGGKRRSNRDYNKINSKYNSDNIAWNHYGEESKDSDDDQQENESEDSDLECNNDDPINMETDHHHNAKVVKKLSATTETDKRRSERLNKQKKYGLTKEALKNIRLEQTVEHSVSNDKQLREQIETQNKRIRALNQKIIMKLPEPATHKIAISDTPILDDLHAQATINDDIIASKQIDDPVCYAIIEFLKTHNSTLLLDLDHLVIKNVLSGRFEYSTNKGLTYLRRGKKLLVVPSYLRKHILKHSHQIFIHHGENRTKNRILQNYYWPGIDADVKELIKYCITCQHKSKSKPKNYKGIIILSI